MTDDLRVATFNASLNRSATGELIEDLSTPDDAQARQVAEIIQRTAPDVLLLNEFDFDASGEAARLFQTNYLGVGQNGQAPIDYPYVYAVPSNTGVPSGLDLDNDGSVGGPGDAQGFGFFEGQYAFVIYSKHPIVEGEVRTFQNFLWKDMPGALLPDDAATTAPNDFYSEEELAVLRLSSKNHVDVPIEVDGKIVHVLAAHPTPPVFDGPEDRNGTRNHDEIRLWDDYVTPGKGGYIYDDAGTFGGLGAGERFVIAGDYNADPFDGDSVSSAIQQLLGNPNVDVSHTPDSEGGIVAAQGQGGANDGHLGNPATDTADFADTTPGNLRADYVLPSRAGLEIKDGGVFWPAPGEPGADLVGASDHRLVWQDLQVQALGNADRSFVEGIEFLGSVTLPKYLEVEGTTLGGLSGLTYDKFQDRYLAISDDRGDIDPVRFYTLKVDLGDGRLDEGDVTVEGVQKLLNGNGHPFAPGRFDGEGIAYGSHDNLFISSEGNVNAGIAPRIGVFNLEGEQFGHLRIDDKFLPDGDSGVRNNLAFESLTVSPDGRTIYTATESALLQDGPVAGLEEGSLARIITYDGTRPTGPQQEFLYEVDPIPVAPVEGGFADNGLVDLVALDNAGTLLALERSFAEGVGNSIRLYEVRTQGATDIQGFDTLLDANGEFPGVDQPVQKELLLDLGTLGIPLDNVEGMTLGPKLADGRQSLLLVSDDNFNPAQQNLVMALAIDTRTVPAVEPTLETPPIIRYDDAATPGPAADPDDPAIWLHPDDPEKSLVITSIKEGGFRVYDLEGQEVQSLSPEGVRYNNVDLIEDFTLRGRQVDLAVFSDRFGDSLAAYEIDPGTRQLYEVTGRELLDPAFSIFGVDDQEATAYGLATWTDPETGRDFAYVTQADGNHVAQLELLPDAAGNVRAELVRTIELPVPTGDPADSQSEGIVVDRELGQLYVALEGEVGILAFDAKPDGGSEYRVVAETGEPFLQPDIEGLAIHYGEDGSGYLIASSQGDATYAVFDRAGDNAYLGSFWIGPSGGIDPAEESDGIDIFSQPLGERFPHGLLVVQDGSDEPQMVFANPEDGEIQNYAVNFHYVGLEQVLDLFA